MRTSRPELVDENSVTPGATEIIPDEILAAMLWLGARRDYIHTEVV